VDTIEEGNNGRRKEWKNGRKKEIWEIFSKMVFDLLHRSHNADTIGEDKTETQTQERNDESQSM
jgi:hypothetical protein